MRTLRACRGATGLLPDIDQARRIFLMRLGMLIFRSHAFFLHDVVIEIAIGQ
jgi:hypothetical protein